ncbi:MAG: hypothetical protein GF418_09285 [Chitinivibrionales bacterium]|nr:hypothetical protein [Chitinivibrionales bacterium]MBD3395801.1 hypothetical protein [Chitinivibrionales bacterium]
MHAFLWDSLKFRHMRLWQRMSESRCDVANDLCTKYMADNYGKTVADAIKGRPHLTIHMGPGYNPTNSLKTHAAQHAKQINRLITEYGFPIAWTGISNEPDNGDKLTPETAAQLVKYYRQELDRYDATRPVKILAPENSGCNLKAIAMVEQINADDEALAALDAYSTHSYNESISDWMEDIMWPFHEANRAAGGTKQHWMTEASSFACEGWDDAFEASSNMSRVLADMNHLCNVWVYYIGIGVRNSLWNIDCPLQTDGIRDGNGFHMVLFRRDEQDWRALLKAYYFKQLGATFDYRCIFRKAQTHIWELNDWGNCDCNDEDNTLPDCEYCRREDTTMVYAFGRKAPLYLAAAKNPDSSWGVAVTNYTGDIAPTAFSELFGPRNYRVTVTIEELADTADMVFRAYRCNRMALHGPTACEEEGPVVLNQGTMVIDSIGSFDLVTLRSYPLDNDVAMRGGRSPGFFSVAGTGTAAHPIQIRFATVPGTEGGAQNLHVAIYDLSGREVRTLFAGLSRPGAHRLVWDGTDNRGDAVSRGVYALRLIYAGRMARSGILVKR